MRRILELIGLGALGLLVWITYQALSGPEPLPDRIPTHFDLAGNPNGWGSPAALLFLPAVAVALYLFISVTALFPATFKYPLRVTPENRPRLQALSLCMIAWIKVELACLFVWIQWSIIESARNGRWGLSPMTVPLFLVAVFGTVAAHMAAMFRAGRAGSGV
jgi:uncharacterized membrane protein